MALITQPVFPVSGRPLALAALLMCLSAPSVSAAQAAQFLESAYTDPTQAKNFAVRLEPGKPIEKALASGETDSYEVQVGAGQFLHVIVDQKGIDVTLALYGPDAKQIAKTDSPKGTTGSEKISAIAESGGAYRLDVASRNDSAPAGRYRASLDPPRPPTNADRARISAERIFAEAVLLQGQGSADSRRRAIQKYEEALPLWRAAGDDEEETRTLASIDSIEASLGKNQRAVDCNNLGGIYSDLGEKQKALDYYSQALSLERAMDDRPAQARTLNGIGLVYAALGESQKALEFYKPVLSFYRSMRDRSGEARVLANIGAVYSALGDLERAFTYYKDALSLERTAGDRFGEARTLAAIGNARSAVGEERKALDYYKEALRLQRAGGDRHAEAYTLSSIGGVYSALGEKQEALDYLNQALSLHRAVGNQRGEAQTMSQIGRVYADLGENQKAEDYCNQALSLARAVGDRYGEASMLNNIGLVYSELGEKKKALDSYNQALPLERAMGNRSGEAASLNNIGLVYSDLGEKKKALDYYNQALPLEQAMVRSKEANTLGNIGRIYSDLGDKQKALDYLNRALALQRAMGNRFGEARTLSKIGRVYSDLSENEKALDYYSQALTLHQAVGDRAAEAATRRRIGFVYYNFGDKHKALDEYSRSMALSLEVGNPQLQEFTSHLLMEYWRDQKEGETAVFFGKQAVNRIQQVRANIGGLEEEDQQTFLKSNETVYRELADLLIAQGRLPEAQQVLDLLKNEEYFEFVRRDSKSASSLTASVNLTKNEESLNREYEENASRVTAVGNEWAVLRAKPSRTPEEEKQFIRLSEQLKAANEAWEKFLSGLYAELGKSKEAQQSVEHVKERASEIQQVVRRLNRESSAGAVAIYTLVGEEKYRIIVVTPTVMVAREYPIKAEELRKKVFDFRETLTNPKSDAAPKAQELYRILVGPAEKDLADAKAETLMWSLDDVLRYLPMAALHDGHGYLVEKYRTEVFTPTSVPSLVDRPDVNAWHGLGMGVSKPYGDFTPLPSVPEELHRIIREKDGASGGVVPGQMMLDEAFTEANMKKALEQNYPLIHIASHFDFAAGNEADSFLLLGGKDAQGERLTLAEIRTDPAFNFADTQLLTLSACNTAVGGVAGDGREVDGLGILAQQKGAHAVVASLWGVYDPSTGVLMQEFYKRWITHPDMTKAEALREAQLTLLREAPAASNAVDGTETNSAVRGYTHPFYWAPFILIGNWR